MFTNKYVSERGKKSNISYFNSVNEYIDYLVNTPPYDSNRENSSHSGSKSFTGTKSFVEAIKLCKYGDERLRSNILKLTKEDANINEYVSLVKQEYKDDVVGFMPNVPNYLLGLPHNMIRSTKKTIPSKVLNIFVNICASSFVDASDIERNASRCVAAIDNLEKQGYRCNVYSCDFGEKSQGTVGKIIKIKSDKEPLNLATMAFPLAHPSMLRRLSFKHAETMEIDLTHSGYGTPMDDKDTIKSYIKENIGIDKAFIFSVSKGGGTVSKIMDEFKK